MIYEVQLFFMHFSGTQSWQEFNGNYLKISISKLSPRRRSIRNVCFMCLHRQTHTCMYIHHTHTHMCVYFLMCMRTHLWYGEQLFQMPSSSLWAPRTEPTAIRREIPKATSCQAPHELPPSPRYSPSLKHLIYRRERQTESTVRVTVG